MHEYSYYYIFNFFLLILCVYILRDSHTYISTYNHVIKYMCVINRSACAVVTISCATMLELPVKPVNFLVCEVYSSCTEHNNVIIPLAYMYVYDSYR